MEMVICAIFDKATSAYMRPFPAQTIGQALRQFSDEANREGTPINAHPEDYSLFHLGNFYDNNAKLEPLEPRCVGRAHELIQPTENS